MSATMLALVQQATGEMGLTVPTVVAGSTSPDTIQQLALLNAVGYEIQRGHPWQAMTSAYIFTTTSTTLVGNTTAGSATVSGIASTAGIDTNYQITGVGINQATYIDAVPSGVTLTLSQPATATATGTTFTLAKVKYAMPSDYDRQINNTHWDKSKHWKMIGPETPQQWQYLISGYIATGPWIRYRILGNKFQIWPMVTSGDSLGFEYVNNSWAATAAGVAKSSFTIDTDTCIFPDRLMVLGLKQKYFEAKGFGDIYGADYQAELDIAKSADGGAQTLAMAPQISQVLINWSQIPESGYGT